MANILARPMFKLGSKPNSDGVGITSGLNRPGYQNSNYEEFQKASTDVLKEMENYGKIGKGEAAFLISDFFGSPGSIYEKTQEMMDPEGRFMQYAGKHAKAQRELPSIKANIYKGLTEVDFAKEGLRIKEKMADKETVQAAMERNAEKALALEEQYGWDMEKMKENEKDYALYKVAKQLSQRNPVSVQQARNTAMKMLEGIIRQESDAFDNFRTLDKEGRANWMQGIVDAIMTGDYSKMPSFAQGGRVGRAYGNPHPMMTETEALDIQTPGMNEEIVATETMQAPQQPNPAQDPYIILRARLPKEITDDVVRLIAYNQEAFKDFAAIETQQDVIDFNQTYGVELVVPALTV